MGGLQMDLGQFSNSLAVKDLKTSLEFYEKFGFEVIGGAMEQSFLILKNGDVVIGLFQDMFNKNILTFNPRDVRSLQKTLKERGLVFSKEANPETSGPDHATLEDPDGNPILLDQHND